MNELLHAYRSLWNNRLLQGEESEVLVEAISRELRDEYTHPRLRKGPHEKYFLATKRIIESNLEPSIKIALLTIHIEQLEKIMSSKREQ